MSIEVGSKVKGKVTGITHFGAFVELSNGKTGLVHISEVANNYVKDIKDHLKVGEQIDVKVIQIEGDGKIGLSIKKLNEEAQASDGTKKGPRKGGRKPYRKGQFAQSMSFEDKISRFLKDSEERLSSLRRQTESKRGGRGSRRG